MSKLYLECYSGLSGDMLVAALIDLGVNQKDLLKALNSIPIDGFNIQISRVKKSGLDICDFNVILDDEHKNHDHDMEFLHGESHEYNHTHNPRLHGASHHIHRGMKEVTEIIAQSEISANAKKLAWRIFEILGEAEAKAHGKTLESVRFHEVGAVDSIVDIIAAAVCMDYLKPDEVIIPILYEGCGTIRCQHGILPVPVPAVANIAAANDLNLHITKCQGELITPTGAAIAAVIRTQKSLPQKFTIKKVGLGAGKRSYESPGFVRAMCIEEVEPPGDVIYKLESNIDDCSGEALGYTMDCLFQAGAKDVSYLPVYMKKNRPAYQVVVICAEEDIDKMEQIIFKQTTSIGIRRVRMERTVLPREIKEIDTSLGKVAVKVCRLKTGDKVETRFYPEYKSITALCNLYHKSYQEIYQLIMRECNENIQ